MANDELDALANKLWIKHRSALDYLMERRPDAASELMSELRRNHATLAQGFSEATGFTVVADASRPGQLHFAVADWDRFEVFAGTSHWTASGRPLLVELTRGGHGGDEPPLHIRLTLGPADPAIRTAIQNALLAGGVRVRETRSPVWSRLMTERLMTVLLQLGWRQRSRIHPLRACIFYPARQKGLNGFPYLSVLHFSIHQRLHVRLRVRRSATG